MHVLTRLPLARRSGRVATVAALTVLGMLSASIASSAPASPAPDTVLDSETVYVVADAYGTPRTTVVVDWLQVAGSGDYTLVDPAPGVTSVESLTDGFEPTLSGDAVTADVSVDGTADFFYRADTSAPLPLEVRATYYLDGVETAPAELAGKSGRLRITLELHNTLERTEVVSYADVGGMEESSEVTYTVPLLCVPQFEIDGTRMTDIVAPDGAQLMTTGSTMTYAVPMVPSPDSSATIEMDATDIELAPLVISVFPKLPASPDFSVADSMAELHDGLLLLGQLSEGHLQVVEGISAGMGAYDLSSVNDAAAGMAELQAALAQMESAAAGLAQLSAGQIAFLDGVIAGIGTSTGGLVALLDGQIALAENTRASNDALLAKASGFAAEYGAYSTDTTSQAAAADFASLATDIGVQDALLDALIDGGDLGAGYMPGLKTTRASLVDIRASLLVLRDGGDPDGAGAAPYMPGLTATQAGLAGLADGLGQASDGLASSSGDMALLGQLPVMMAGLQSTLDALAHGGTIQGQQLPGIDTTVEALGTTSAGIGDGVDTMREGEAMTEAMASAADAYTSFLGLPEGAEGHLSLLYKLDGVSK